MNVGTLNDVNTKRGENRRQQQYNLNNVMTTDNGEQNNLSVLEQYMESESLQDAYAKLCNINNVANVYKIDDESQYYHCNNIMRCKANVEYIARLSRHNKRKALTIIDG